MPLTDTASIRQLGPEDVALMEALLGVLGEAFDRVETYGAARPTGPYLQRLLRPGWPIPRR